ncbi:hypothetical protein G7Y79_00047g083550 [Physcia stellaris]|nr:hypothetical protein G7Y79_00047g083550 [Physcia stellaris]
MSPSSNASTYRSLTSYCTAATHLSSTDPSPPSLATELAELLAEIDANIARTACGTASLPALLRNLYAYLLAKIADGISATAPAGRPNLNRHIHYAMLKCADHPRFGELRMREGKWGREDGAPDFATLWRKMEEHRMVWAEGAGRMRRWAEGQNLRTVARWFMGVELDGRRCLAYDGD